MDCIHYFLPEINPDEIPSDFPDPFNAEPHSLARRACRELQVLLNQPGRCPHNFDTVDGGKMFGVLVVRDNEGQVGFLSAFSGMLAGRWLLPGFVPPIFDITDRDTFLPGGEFEIVRLSKNILMLENGSERKNLLNEYKRLLHQRDVAMAMLKELHGSRKALRHERRANLLHGIGDLAATEREKILVRLSFESQQDRREQRKMGADWNARLNPVLDSLDLLDCKIEGLRKVRSQLSRRLHKKIFSTYKLINAEGKQRNLSEFFDSDNPPGGAGDCAAPKLINYANKQKLVPLALAEFWWGASPSAEIRHHGHFYPPCRGKCGPILPFMLDGLRLQSLPKRGDHFHDPDMLSVIYEDDELLVVNKPSGLLSVPGKELKDSVLTRLQHRYPAGGGPFLVHRLDMATSGLLLAAKNRGGHKILQKQFLARTIEKRYVAVLDGILTETFGKEGIVDLPLRVDIDDRPRQLVCFEHGKEAVTRWELVSCENDRMRVYFYPLTGRTHQLRIHSSHRDGLNIPIVGDELYGVKANRLLLHAERLCFTHPLTGKRIELEEAAPF